MMNENVLPIIKIMCVFCLSTVIYVGDWTHVFKHKLNNKLFHASRYLTNFVCLLYQRLEKHVEVFD